MKIKQRAFFLAVLIVLDYSSITQAMDLSDHSSGTATDEAVPMTVEQEFLRAVEQEKVKVFKKLLSGNHELIRSCNAAQETALHWASRSSEAILMILIDVEGADLTARTVNRETPLHLAVKSGFRKAVEVLIAKKVTLNDQDNKGHTPLMLAIQKGNIELVTSLVSNGASLEIQDSQGYRALHWAVKCNESGIVFDLLEKNAVIDAQDALGRTPLHLAVALGHMNQVKLLLERNASVSLEDLDAKTSLHYTLEKTLPDMVALLLENNADIDAQDNHSQTLLHLAVINHRTDVVELLLKNGADVEAQDDQGCTPLHLAVRTHQMNLIELLLKNGADVEAQDDQHQTALHVAIRAQQNASNVLLLSNKTDLVELLLKNTADINAQDVNGETPLYLAIGFHNQDLVRFLIMHGASMDVLSAVKNTPFSEMMGDHVQFFISMYQGLGPEFRSVMLEKLTQNLKQMKNFKNKSLACRALFLLEDQQFERAELLGLCLDGCLLNTGEKIKFAQMCRAPITSEFLVSQNKLRINLKHLGDLEPSIKTVAHLPYENFIQLIKKVMMKIESEELELKISKNKDQHQADLLEKLARMQSQDNLEKIFAKVETSLQPYFVDSSEEWKSIVGQKLMVIAHFLNELSLKTSKKADEILCVEVKIFVDHLQACLTGTQEGIEYSYNRLASYELSKIESLATENFHPFMDGIVRQIKNEIVENHMFTHEIDADDGDQRVHLTRAIRGILGREIGLWVNGQKFEGDRLQTDNIFNVFAFLGVPRCSDWKMYLLQEFLSFYSPRYLMVSFQDKVNTWLMQKNPKNYNQLIKIFDQGGIQEISEAYFDESFLLTQAGAEALLLTYGYLSKD